jgi:hypothetical protein
MDAAAAERNLPEASARPGCGAGITDLLIYTLRVDRGEPDRTAGVVALGLAALAVASPVRARAPAVRTMEGIEGRGEGVGV